MNLSTAVSTSTVLCQFSNVTALNGCIPTTTLATTPRSNPDALLLQILWIVANAVGMIGIGCALKYKTIWYYIKRPKAYLTGVALQLLMVPPIAWALTKIFQTTQVEALGVMIQGSAPGGSISNLVVYWMDGIVDLSVTMTATSTTLALGTMPLWLFIFSKAEQLNDDLVVPFQDLGIVVASLLGPLLVGFFISFKFPKVSQTLAKVFTAFASLAILALLIYEGITGGPSWRFTWKQIVIVLLMPIIIFTITFVATVIPIIDLSSSKRTTVAVESTLQNAQIAAAVMRLSFSYNLALLSSLVVVPVLYFFVQVAYSVLLVVALRLAKNNGWVKSSAGLAEDSPGTDEFTTDQSKEEKCEKMDVYNNQAFTVESIAIRL